MSDRQLPPKEKAAQDEEPGSVPQRTPCRGRGAHEAKTSKGEEQGSFP